MPDPKPMTPGQRAYEQKRAAKSGKSLDAHLTEKQKRSVEEAKATAPPPAPKPPGMFKRLLDRAHQPLKKP